MTEWQPIETAPRETMKSVLLHSPEGEQIGWWSEGQNKWLTDEGKLLWAEPTHWMPLPAPPTAPRRLVWMPEAQQIKSPMMARYIKARDATRASNP